MQRYIEYKPPTIGKCFNFNGRCSHSRSIYFSNLKLIQKMTLLPSTFAVNTYFIGTLEKQVCSYNQTFIPTCTDKEICRQPLVIYKLDIYLYSEMTE